MLAGVLISLVVTGVAASSEPFPEVAKLEHSDADCGDALGTAVAIDDRTIVVGAKFEESHGEGQAGAAHVYLRRPEGWAELARLVASDPTADAEFGRAVAIDARSVIVGAPQLFAGDGKAYIFERDSKGSGAFAEVARLRASDSREEIRFGYSVAVDGNTAVVGAPDPFSGNGAAYVFVRDVEGWAEAAKLEVPSDSVFGDELGRSVAVQGDAVVVGAPGYGIGGGAWVFERTPGTPGGWRMTTRLTPSSSDLFDDFGESVAIDGNTVVVGAPGADPVCCESGAAYVFERSHEGSVHWSQVAKLVAADAEPSDRLGFSVAVSGGLVLTGAPEIFNGGQGSAYLFGRNHEGRGHWGKVGKLVGHDTALSDSLGWGVAIHGKNAVVGAPWHDPECESGGAAYVFEACGGDPAVLCLRYGRFRVEVTWKDSTGESGFGQAVELPSTDSGVFWFFRESNWEMQVKVLDACDLNDRYWVFAAASTNVGYLLRVTDVLRGITREYENTVGTRSAAITDNDAFATCP